jgi:hypothetical protein
MEVGVVGGGVHGGEHGKRSCIKTPVKLMYPKLRAKTGRVPGGAKMNKTPQQTTGAPKCMMPYGSHANTSSNGEVCFDRIFDKFAPYSILSTAGSIRTEISGRQSAGIKLGSIRLCRKRVDTLQSKRGRPM